MTVSNNAAPVVTDKNIETAVISGGGTSTGDVPVSYTHLTLPTKA